MRFLTQANKTKVSPARRRANRVMIEQGNDAAHRADGNVDAVLFHAGLLSFSQDASAFEEVYGISVDSYVSSTPRWQRIYDLYATVNTRKFDNASIEKINQMVVKLCEFGDGLEEGDEAEDLLAVLKSEVDDIIAGDRWGNIHRHDYTNNVLCFLPMVLCKYADSESGKLY